MTAPVLAESTREAFCQCGMIIPHYWEGAVFRPIPHEAPCGLPCPSGGIAEGAWVLGRVHRGDDCPACEED